MKFVGNIFAPVLTLVAIIWIVEAVNFLLGHRFTTFGVLPRNFNGLIGIPLSPFIHGGLWHAVSCRDN